MGDLAPFSQESEEAVIGAVLVDAGMYPVIATFLKADDFYILRHMFIWDAFTRIHNRHEPIDFITVTTELRALDHLEDIGGAAYLLALTNSTGATYNAEVYGKIVQRAAVRRRLLLAADKMRALAVDEELSVEHVLSDAERQFSVVRDSLPDTSGQTFPDMISDLMDTVEERMRNPDLPVGVPTGFHDLDELTGGMHRGELTILAARPGMGKTSLMISIALNAARLGYRIGIFSQEMDRQQIVLRMAAIETGINSHTLRLGRIDMQQYARFVKACGDLSNLPIYVDDASGLTIQRLRRKSLTWLNNGGLDAAMVDYLQILSSDGEFKGNQRVQEVGWFARGLKQLARELHIPILAAAQLSRALESRTDKRPQLSDLRESGEIEQEADLVQFIYRDVVYNEACEFPSRADIITSKHRNGTTGIISLHFEKSTTRFSDSHTKQIDLRQL